MKREVVQDFLNLPGIAGVALMDGRSRPFFCGLDQTLTFQQRETLAQGIQQVLATTLASFEQFEFQFARYQVHLHKIAQGFVLLILASVECDPAAYQSQTEQLKRELQQDLANAIATFRLLSGTITLSQQNYWKQSNAQVSSRLDLPATDPNQLVSALNQLSQLAVQYLGATVSSNYWRATRPPWLSDFEVDRTACIRFTGALACGCSDQQQQIQAWVAAFVDRCTQIIRDFPLLIQHRLNLQSYRLLFTCSEPQKEVL